MDWLYEHGFLSWSGVLAIIIVVYLIWTERKHAKTPMGKRHAEFNAEMKERARTLREEKKSRR
ncbi:Uncharacterised protein [Enterobacter hormaechei]|jgi:hypothetical protein|uniref:hypothetical protein n=1 Tax=Enterobacteriaceae TaxID=543 RepID=UPI00079C2BB5|nr:MULTISPECIES: hypothetical protein [Enterobacteriaceae]HDS9658366.1 hypothetical protein [Klebsiella pneumoniae subsp. pneumoniae]HEO9916001.1 hypothetical protein [Enterobacter asburiae]MCL5533682.1 hypothetical protein [Enterobacter kobei]MCL8169839.1 hypothetical protein [Enterobacter kobei]MCM7797484.1 hypothetical protein [Enterobacter kobei]